MIGLRVRTAGGSTYLLGPSRDQPGQLRLARVSEHDVAGSPGTATFVEDFVAVEVVAEDGQLRLRFTHINGNRFQTSAIIEITEEQLTGVS